MGSRREHVGGEREAQPTTKPTTEWRYYISSRLLDAKQFNQAICQH